MRVPNERNLFRPQRPSYNRVLVLLALVVAAAIWANSVFQGLNSGEVTYWFAPTPTATRVPISYLQEGEAYFEAGALDKAITAFEEALLVDPNNVQVLTDLARIQTYSSAALTPDEKHQRLQEALANIERAVELDDINSDALAVQALTLDWFATSGAADNRAELLIDAGRAATRALQIDNQNVLALAYQAEVLIDQQQWVQAEQVAKRALDREPNLMDTNRVYAYVLENTGQYSLAIEFYKKAAEINPNLTFLYIKIGQMYRQLRLYDEALDFFDRAAQINAALGINDPLPYIAIAKTYTRDGQFFAASRNAETAVELDRSNPDVYGQLGIIRFKARNYEGSVAVLRCAVSGCPVASVPDGEMLEASLDYYSLLREQGVQVPGLPLTGNSLEYYLTFSSALAAFGRCREAGPLFDQIRAQFPDDPVTMAVVQENETVCSLFSQ